jgi:hypothetical protein
MSDAAVTRHGIEGTRPDRDATVGVNAGRRNGQRGEQPTVPDATFTSYYGKPVLNQPSWKAPDIPGYLFLGGLAGGASVIAAAADVTGRRTLATGSKVGAIGALGLGMAGLVHDLGRPARFANMLRVFKPTSPMNMGSWILAAYGPAAGAAAAGAVTGWFPKLSRTATVSAAAIGPFVAAYTGALLADTAIPAWHDAYRELPFVFVGSGMIAAAGLGMVVAPLDEIAPAQRAAVAGTLVEIVASRRMERRLGMVAEPYKQGRSGRFARMSDALALAGAAGALVFGRKSRVAAAACGVTLIAASALTKFAVFEAGFVSANDPRYTVEPQRERVDREHERTS